MCYFKGYLEGRIFYIRKMRETIDHIVEKRRRRKKIIFLTGGTGFVGSHLAVELLKRGYFVILLSRPKRNLNAFERVQQILRWHNFPYNENLKVVSGQITEPQLGLDDEMYVYLLENIDEIWHCASDTSFSENKRKQIEKVNVYGTLNVLKLAVESKCYFFHHMSTAYVAGKTHGVCKEEYVPQKEFYNVYEETKYKAEGYVLEICRKEGIRTNMYRPSIIYGDSRSGKTLIFNAFYFPIRIVNFFKGLYERDIEQNNGLNAEKMGVRKTDEGQIYLPIRIGKVETGTFNLVPINFVVDGCIAIMENCLDGGILHLINRKPSKIEDLIIFGKKFLNVRGIKAVPENDFDNQPKNALEELFYSYNDVYQPYFRDDRIFDARKAEEILERDNIVCPYLDYEIFSRCIRYAIGVDWGKHVFSKEEEK